MTTVYVPYPVTGPDGEPVDLELAAEVSADGEVIGLQCWSPNPTKHLLKGNWPEAAWTEVQKEDWIQAERDAGFRPKMPTDDSAYMSTYATAGFSGPAISGRIENHFPVPEWALPQIDMMDLAAAVLRRLEAREKGWP